MTIIGIDLGTSNSAAAYYDPFTNRAECVGNQDGGTLTPSVVSFMKGEDGKPKLSVGRTARECSILSPESTVALVKRMMGKSDKSGNPQKATAIDGRETAYSPQQVSSFILKSLKADAEQELDEEISDAVITVPAYFEDEPRKATEEAGRIAGFKNVYLLAEPLAAALSADTRKNYTNKKILVFDLGGGTLDIDVISFEEDKIQELLRRGNNHLGGSDWDTALIGHIRQTCLKDDKLDVCGEQELAIKACEAKERLSKNQDTFFTVTTEKGPKKVTVTRAEFEACTRPLLDKVIEELKGVKAWLSKNHIRLDQILLVGGATRMVQIETCVAAAFPGVHMVGKNDRDEAVAKGAAIYARNYVSAGNTLHMTGQAVTPDGMPHKTLSQVTAYSYGIAAWSDGEWIVSVLVHRGDALPVKNEHIYYTRNENQRQCNLKVYECTTDQDHAEVKDEDYIGMCYLDIRGNLPKESPIHVQLSLGDDGILQVYAYEESGNTEISATLHTNALLSEDELMEQKKTVDALS